MRIQKTLIVLISSLFLSISVDAQSITDAALLDNQHQEMVVKLYSKFLESSFYKRNKMQDKILRIQPGDVQDKTRELKAIELKKYIDYFIQVFNEKNVSSESKLEMGLSKKEILAGDKEIEEQVARGAEVPQTTEISSALILIPTLSVYIDSTPNTIQKTYTWRFSLENIETRQKVWSASESRSLTIQLQ